MKCRFLALKSDDFYSYSFFCYNLSLVMNSYKNVILDGIIIKKKIQTFRAMEIVHIYFQTIEAKQSCSTPKILMSVLDNF